MIDPVRVDAFAVALLVNLQQRYAAVQWNFLFGMPEQFRCNLLLEPMAHVDVNYKRLSLLL